jgi:hypothetical protein
VYWIALIKVSTIWFLVYGGSHSSNTSNAPLSLWQAF